eukprot:15025615-Heterocapsa_arctica.AAC.1
MNLVLIKAVPRGGVEVDRKRKCEAVDSKTDDYKRKGHMGKQSYAKPWGKGAGWQAPSSGWQAP